MVPQEPLKVNSPPALIFPQERDPDASAIIVCPVVPQLPLRAILLG